MKIIRAIRLYTQLHYSWRLAWARAKKQGESERHNAKIDAQNELLRPLAILFILFALYIIGMVL